MCDIKLLHLWQFVTQQEQSNIPNPIFIHLLNEEGPLL